MREKGVPSCDRMQSVGGGRRAGCHRSAWYAEKMSNREREPRERKKPWSCRARVDPAVQHDVHGAAMPVARRTTASPLSTECS